jgi:hypothetical protein
MLGRYLVGDDYERQRDAEIARRAANIAWAYKNELKNRDSFSLPFRAAVMEGYLESLLIVFEGVEGEFGL